MPNDTILFYSQGACSLGPFVVLEWVAEPYRICRVERAERPTERYKRINPLGAVPALKVDGRVIVENAAVLAHLAARKPELGLLAPAGTALGDRHNFWLSYLGTTFHPAFYPFFAVQRYASEESHHADVKATAQKQIRGVFQYVDEALRGNAWLGGEQRSALDAYLYAMSRWGKKMFDLPNDFPEIARHQTAMEAEPAVQYVLDIEQQRPAISPSGAMVGTVPLDSA